MPSSKPNLESPKPSTDEVDKIVRKAPTLIRENQSLTDILRILRQDNAISAWLESGEHSETDLFILLADKLSSSEREALEEASDAVVRGNDNLTRRIADLERENQDLKSLSLTDGLTGLFNYRFFAKQLEVEMARTTRTGQPCSLLMIDLDNFKLLNDTLGHDEGNRFLVMVAQVILEKLRPTDIMCRYGGDEFAVIMPATALFDAVRISRRLRESVANIPPKLETPFSASIGLAEYDPSSGQEMSVLVNMADKALYRAKKSGKNRICYEGKLPKLGKPAPVTLDEKAALLDRNDE
jgi:diguanylate cyclase (GGDEF)-like protein